MADKLKEFVNKTFTSADVVNNIEIPLFTTAATTQAVIKDVQIGDAATVSFNTYINDFKVASGSGSGSEIVDNNSTVKAVINKDINLGVDSFVEAFVFDTNVITSKNFLRSNIPLVVSPKYQDGTSIVSFSTNPTSNTNTSFVYINANGTIFHAYDDGNATQGLYKSTDGGTTWINTSFIPTSYCPIWFDGDIRAYCSYSSACRVYNLETETTEPQLNFTVVIGTASYPTLRTVNNFIMSTYSSYTSSLFYVASDGIQKGSFSIPFSISQAGAINRWNIAHDSITDTYYMFSFISSNTTLGIYKTQAGTGLEINNLNMSWSLVANITGLSFYDQSNNVIKVIGSKAYYRNSSNKYDEIDYINGVVTKDVFVANGTYSESITAWKKTVASAITDYNIIIPTRITGVESTGV